ncbi:MAG TPA: hypothetical protein VD794_03540, partial [Flavisolibacter sp.]|nr:hypothetical protein [Flavisolibacter sp.]
MQKSYLLLRNNQQSGPYSLDEVKQLPLQSKDLIWIIGQSAGWRYPEEIDALKTTIDESKSLPEKKSLKEPDVIDATPMESVPVATRLVYVSMPGKAVAPSTAPVVSDTETLSFDERVEKMRQRIALASTAKVENEDATVEVKYSRSLEDI